ncbi:flagellar protein FliS [Desulfofarcimen acetoxidans DSM 771]|uniref:Flagellar protein FliS n=1 Tax=Desulfofarcimen acetoxidans (strain ATCC 49208 / DSM 771 / KCTC 5769 / VKM B-1644 / 5575) TaxID=485916 RepID=C8W1D7_DESAS|nr:flagellar export chaperone FliS [Desulfofarcimen acetoxidans]ACV61582.1 flagellar protein FliS [Desulfofarcimen acetoxidans DSM 771]
MAVFNPYQQYQQNSITSAKPGQLTLMLYNGAIKFIKTAILGMEKKDIGTANGAVIRAQEIIRYLDHTLDPQYEISQNLSSLYDYIYRRLVEANINKNAAVLEEVVSMVEELRDTWMSVLKKTS